MSRHLRLPVDVAPRASYRPATAAGMTSKRRHPGPSAAPPRRGGSAAAKRSGWAPPGQIRATARSNVGSNSTAAASTSRPPRLTRIVRLPATTWAFVTT
jgi:hypothetical protein